MYLEKINAPEDVKKLNQDEMNALAAEMRQALMFRLSKHGGHFGPNFGMVETTIALHYVFDSPKDKIVFDVSHQSYPHKMLTGRKDAYLYEEHFDDISGYTDPHESKHDFFTVGHTSTSVSLASGLAKGRDLNGESGNVIAVIGDGSLSGGEALEGLDFAGEMDTNFIIVVNDNDMSIAENHGGLYKNLKLLRDTDGKYVFEHGQHTEYVDSFGHKQLSGTAKYLSALVSEKIGCKSRAIELSTLQRCAGHLTSRVDITEAYQVGGYAVKSALEGETGKMVILKRVSEDPYICTTDLYDVHKIANIEKKVPVEWIKPDGSGVSDKLINYIRPLIQAELTPIMITGQPRHIVVDIDNR